jgi:hypothetical protein
MNPNQFTTLDEAQSIAKQIGAAIGGGVETVYIPTYGGPYVTPEIGESKFYHFRFHNGADGFNAGLIRQSMKFSPSRWPLMLAVEVQAAANSGDRPW